MTTIFQFFASLTVNSPFSFHFPPIFLWKFYISFPLDWQIHLIPPKIQNSPKIQNFPHKMEMMKISASFPHGMDAPDFNSSSMEDDRLLSHFGVTPSEHVVLYLRLFKIHSWKNAAIYK